MIVSVKALTDNIEVLNSARSTVNKQQYDKKPSDKFMMDIYMSEHSPIRNKIFKIRIEGVKSWIATHLVRHNVGVTSYVTTQRDDRTGSNRDEARQDALVNIEMTANAQAIINISRKRLCGQAHVETISVWRAVLKELDKIDPQLRFHCVPECVRCGFCPELKPCSFDYSTWRKIYVGDRKVLGNE